MDSNTKFFAGLIAGIGIGTLVGLLVAPDKGSETYKKLEGAMKDAANDLMDMGSDAVKSAREKAETVSKKA